MPRMSQAAPHLRMATITWMSTDICEASQHCYIGTSALEAFDCQEPHLMLWTCAY